MFTLIDVGKMPPSSFICHVVGLPCVLPQKQCSDMRVSHVNSSEMIRDFEFEQSTQVHKRKEATPINNIKKAWPAPKPT